MATRFDGGDILWWVWGPREPQEEREERLLFALLPLYLPTLPSFSSLSPSTSGTTFCTQFININLNTGKLLDTLFNSHQFKAKVSIFLPFASLLVSTFNFLVCIWKICFWNFPVSTFSGYIPQFFCNSIVESL